MNDARGQRYFSNAILCAVLASIPWMLAGAFVPGALLRLMGGDAGIVTLGIPYARIFLLFTPFFMCNYIVSAFVRNDGDPSLAMVATLSGSLFNVVFDYIFNGKNKVINGQAEVEQGNTVCTGGLCNKIGIGQNIARSAQQTKNILRDIFKELFCQIHTLFPFSLFLHTSGNCSISAAASQPQNPPITV